MMIGASISSEREYHAAVRAEVDFRVGQARHHGAEQRQLDAHHQPAQGEREPRFPDIDTGDGLTF